MSRGGPQHSGVAAHRELEPRVTGPRVATAPGFNAGVDDRQGSPSGSTASRPPLPNTERRLQGSQRRRGRPRIWHFSFEAQSMGFSFRGRSAPARCIRHLISVRPDDMTGCGSPKVLRGRKFKETRSTVYLQQVLSAILTGCILMTLLVGAGQFERPPPCAQGSFRHGSKLARFQVLRFQGDTANALQVVERSGSQRLPAATFLSTAVQWGCNEAGDRAGGPRWRLRQNR
jgi:hypothetical protein